MLDRPGQHPPDEEGGGRLLASLPGCVVEGVESVRECPVWKEFVRLNEIKLKKEK